MTPSEAGNASAEGLGVDLDLDPTELDLGFRRYLEKLASEGGYSSVDDFVGRLTAPEPDGQTEISNRTTYNQALGELLRRGDYSADEVLDATQKIWALSGRQDIIRRTRFLQSPRALEDIRALLDDSSQAPIEVRVAEFISAATSHGYGPVKGTGKDPSGIASFASVLLSSLYPDRFVDFRAGRWNALYKGITETTNNLVSGSDYGRMLLRASAFARLLAGTPNFRHYFGEQDPLWTASGVAWFLKDGPPIRRDIETMTSSPTDPALTLPPLPAKNIILYGPPGTGKTWALRTRYLARFSDEATISTPEQHAEHQWKSGEPVKGQALPRHEFVTFHQSYSYEDFVEGIKPVLDAETAGQLSYEVKPGIFLELARRADADREHDYVLFIDEINRGNVASIFGELITLLEPDKRLDAAHAITVRLPYSRTMFGVPPNLYVIGTMNTADRSIEALDAALRRRFLFVPCRPDPETLPAGNLPGLDVDLRQLLTVMNARLERLLDRDHCIGHSYFLEVAESEEPLGTLRQVMANKVMPLLEEYFYRDPARIGLVLGERFVWKRKQQQPLALLQDTDGDVDGRDLYEFADVLNLGEEAFRAIYE